MSFASFCFASLLFILQQDPSAACFMSCLAFLMSCLAWFAMSHESPQQSCLASPLALAVSAPAVLFLGALGAFAKTYRDWQRNRTWPIWQGAGWFLATRNLHRRLID